MSTREGTRKFGWCLDNLHEACIEWSISGNRCSCECHKREE